jgi:uncharacterized membrane protein YdjX (TVP38/TMEM64 family)
LQSRPGDWLRLLLPAAILASLALGAWRFGLFTPEGARRITAMTAHGPGRIALPVAFIALYVILAALAMPIGPLAYAAGAAFGFTRGSIYVWLASIAGAALGYYLACGILAKAARRMLGDKTQRFGNLRNGNVALNVFRVQLIPIIPFGLFNYAAAIGRIPFWKFLLGTSLGILPGTLLAVFVGDQVRAGVSSHERTPLILAAAVALVIIALSFLPALLKRRPRSAPSS